MFEAHDGVTISIRALTAPRNLAWFNLKHCAIIFVAWL